MDKIYSFRRSYGRTHHTFYIRKSGITIVGTCAGGGGTIKLSDEEKIKRVAEEASAQDLLSIRIAGLSEIANRVRRIQRLNQPTPPVLQWRSRRFLRRLAESRGLRVVVSEQIRSLKDRSDGSRSSVIDDSEF